MNTNRLNAGWLMLLALSTINSQLSTAFAQGSLTPPGAPAPTMKSLDQVEARTIVNAANTPGDANNLFIITNSGSYYLTTNLVGVSGKSGIEITANNVTLDLNGFAVQGAGEEDETYGIVIPGARTNITVRNGAISGWGQAGVATLYVFNQLSLFPVNIVVEHLNVSGNFINGIFIINGVVRDCNCHNNGGEEGGTGDCNGIVCEYGVISGCTANNNVYDGIEMNSGTVSGCSVQNNGANGITCYEPCNISGCVFANNYTSGIAVRTGSEVIGNTCIGNNTANDTYNAGIYIYSKNNRVEGNHVTASGHAGIVVDNTYGGDSTNNIIIKNSVSGNGANNCIIPAGNVVGPLITTTGTITNLNPWANFSY
jgi:parallel beta-helix repeat protein